MTNIHDMSVERIDGAPTKLDSFAGKVLLIVNVASKCGLTKQYEGLEKLYEEKRGAGLEILGFPANNFKEQEPGSNAEIAEFCKLTYGVDFPMFAKISVAGTDKHPLYQRLTGAIAAGKGGQEWRDFLEGRGIAVNPEPEVLWNFEKFLIDRQGNVIDRFAPNVEASDPRVRQAIDAALKG